SGAEGFSTSLPVVRAATAFPVAFWTASSPPSAGGPPKAMKQTVKSAEPAIRPSTSRTRSLMGEPPFRLSYNDFQPRGKRATQTMFRHEEGLVCRRCHDFLVGIMCQTTWAAVMATNGSGLGYVGASFQPAHRHLGKLETCPHVAAEPLTPI